MIIDPQQCIDREREPRQLQQCAVRAWTPGAYEIANFARNMQECYHRLAERDIQKLSHFLGLSEKLFLDKHTARDENGVLILRRNAQGCEFLEGNDCTVYEARPGNCERFPHLLRGSGSLESRMWDLVDRATYCPIVYNWMEKVKGLTKFRPSSGG